MRQSVPNDGDPCYGLLMLKPSREPGVAVVFHMFKDLSESEFQQYEKAVRALRHAMEGDLTVYVLDALQSLQELVQQIRRLVEHNSAAAVVASSKGMADFAYLCGPNLLRSFPPVPRAD